MNIRSLCGDRVGATAHGTEFAKILEYGYCGTARRIKKEMKRHYG